MNIVSSVGGLDRSDPDSDSGTHLFMLIYTPAPGFVLLVNGEERIQLEIQCVEHRKYEICRVQMVKIYPSYLVSV